MFVRTVKGLQPTAFLKGGGGGGVLTHFLHLRSFDVTLGT